MSSSGDIRLSACPRWKCTPSYTLQCTACTCHYQVLYQQYVQQLRRCQRNDCLANKVPPSYSLHLVHTWKNVIDSVTVTVLFSVLLVTSELESLLLACWCHSTSLLWHQVNYCRILQVSTVVEILFCTSWQNALIFTDSVLNHIIEQYLVFCN